jgi:hypothetical protein
VAVVVVVVLVLTATATAKARAKAKARATARATAAPEVFWWRRGFSKIVAGVLLQMPHTPHTPHTPGGGGGGGGSGGNSGPPSVAPSVSQDTSGNNLNTSTGSGVPGVADTSDIIASDLNFDPAAVIDGDAGQEALNVSHCAQTIPA